MRDSDLDRARITRAHFSSRKRAKLAHLTILGDTWRYLAYPGTTIVSSDQGSDALPRGHERICELVALLSRRGSKVLVTHLSLPLPQLYPRARDNKTLPIRAFLCKRVRRTETSKIIKERNDCRYARASLAYLPACNACISISRTFNFFTRF